MSMATDEHCSKRTLVLGCGNVLYGDDGFGPVVADELLERYSIPPDAAVLNLGLGTRGFIFDVLLSERQPRRIVVVDAMDRAGKRPGELFEVPLDELSREKVDDFSFHQGPTSNLLRELRDLCGVEIVIVCCQPQEIPAEMTRGLSAPVREAASEAARLVFERHLAPPGGAADPAPRPNGGVRR
jgi:coenzyme F420 hydrogenase subunit delta